jgi:hypothetical protein
MEDTAKIELPWSQAKLLEGLAEDRGLTLSEFLDDALNEWLKVHALEKPIDDEWRERLGKLLDERARIASQLTITDEEAERIIEEEIAAVRAEKATRRARRP